MIITTKINAINKVLYTSLIATLIYVALLKATSKFNPDGKLGLIFLILSLISFDSSTVDAPLRA